MRRGCRSVRYELLDDPDPLVTGKRSGETTLFLWQAVPIYDPESRQWIAPPHAEVEVAREGKVPISISVAPGQVIAAQI